MRALRAKAVREVSIESHFVKRAKQYGCLQRKLSQLDGVEGWPDRLCVWPDGLGTTDYVELKRPHGGRFERKQEEIQDALRDRGAHVEVLRTKQQVDDYFVERAKALGVKKREPAKRSKTLAKLLQLQKEY